MENPYWERITTIADAQRAKGIITYGQGLEDNKSPSPAERIQYLQEEMVDALMYCEWLKDSVPNAIDEYQKQAMRTANKYENAAGNLKNGALGLTGEAGEVADLVKKVLFQGHELDKEHLVKELGDVAWYLALLASAIEVPLSTVFRKNIEKLKERYPEGFDSERSKHRKEGDV